MNKGQKYIQQEPKQNQDSPNILDQIHMDYLKNYLNINQYASIENDLNKLSLLQSLQRRGSDKIKFLKEKFDQMLYNLGEQLRKCQFVYQPNSEVGNIFRQFDSDIYQLKQISNQIQQIQSEIGILTNKFQENINIINRQIQEEDKDLLKIEDEQIKLQSQQRILLEKTLLELTQNLNKENDEITCSINQLQYIQQGFIKIISNKDNKINLIGISDEMNLQNIILIDLQITDTDIIQIIKEQFQVLINEPEVLYFTLPQKLPFLENLFQNVYQSLQQQFSEQQTENILQNKDIKMKSKEDYNITNQQNSQIHRLENQLLDVDSIIIENSKESQINNEGKNKEVNIQKMHEIYDNLQSSHDIKKNNNIHQHKNNIFQSQDKQNTNNDKQKQLNQQDKDNNNKNQEKNANFQQQQCGQQINEGNDKEVNIYEMSKIYDNQQSCQQDNQGISNQMQNNNVQQKEAIVGQQLCQNNRQQIIYQEEQSIEILIQKKLLQTASEPNTIISFFIIYDEMKKNEIHKQILNLQSKIKFYKRYKNQTINFIFLELINENQNLNNDENNQQDYNKMIFKINYNQQQLIQKNVWKIQTIYQDRVRKQHIKQKDEYHSFFNEKILELNNILQKQLNQQQVITNQINQQRAQLEVEFFQSREYVEKSENLNNQLKVKIQKIKEFQPHLNKVTYHIQTLIDELKSHQSINNTGIQIIQKVIDSMYKLNYTIKIQKQKDLKLFIEFYNEINLYSNQLNQ